MMKDIVREVMAEHRLGPDEFFRSRLKPHVAARMVAIKRLHRTGRTAPEIARVMRCDPTTIGYWVDDDRRARKKAQRRRYWRARRVCK